MADRAFEKNDKMRRGAERREEKKTSPAPSKQPMEKRMEETSDLSRWLCYIVSLQFQANNSHSEQVSPAQSFFLLLCQYKTVLFQENCWVSRKQLQWGDFFPWCSLLALCCHGFSELCCRLRSELVNVGHDYKHAVVMLSHVSGQACLFLLAS